MAHKCLKYFFSSGTVGCEYDSLSNEFLDSRDLESVREDVLIIRHFW